MSRAHEHDEALDRPFRHTRRFAQAQPQARACDRPGCEAEGVHRAPRGRDRLDEYYWFCLQHVREYNRAWNYYAGMNEAQIEAERRRDSTWRRPSWPFGSIGAGPGAFRDDFGFFEEERADERASRRQWRHNRHGRSGDDAGSAGNGHDGAFGQALAELDLQPPVGFAAVKARYKQLVKRLHPDANGGDRTHEDRLKLVNQAYATLRAAYK